MKKNIIIVLASFVILSNLTSCATVFGGKVEACQKNKPVNGTKRDVRIGALVLDILLFAPGTLVDFMTGAIYTPCNEKNKNNVLDFGNK